MENQQVIWRETYRTTKKIAVVTFATGLLTFVCALLASLYFHANDEIVFTQIVMNHYGLIGMIVFGSLSISCYVVAKETKDVYHWMTAAQIAAKVTGYRTLRDTATMFFMLFWACIFITPHEDIRNWYEGNLPEAVLVALGFGVLGLSVLMQSMALHVKNKYLTH